MVGQSHSESVDRSRLSGGGGNGGQSQVALFWFAVAPGINYSLEEGSLCLEVCSGTFSLTLD